MPAKFWVGTSGWHYDDWSGRYYPADLPRKDWLAFYCRDFQTTEINNSFYRLPKPETWASWKLTAPESFLFSVKAHRLITHQKKLKDGAGYLENFLEHAALLGERLGPILFQLPGTWHANPERLAGFVERLPAGRFVIEFRHESWLADEILEVMRSHHVAFCCFDMPEMDWPVRVTAEFAYMRFHGAGKRYAGRYPTSALKRWARILRELAEDVKEVFVYFNNDYRGHAIQNARTLTGLLTGSGA